MARMDVRSIAHCDVQRCALVAYCWLWRPVLGCGRHKSHCCNHGDLSE